MSIRHLAAVIALLALVGTAVAPAFADTAQNQKGMSALDEFGNSAKDEFGNPIARDPELLNK